VCNDLAEAMKALDGKKVLRCQRIAHEKVLNLHLAAFQNRKIALLVLKLGHHQCVLQTLGAVHQPVQE
jgi:hypothetical protein